MPEPTQQNKQHSPDYPPQYKAGRAPFRYLELQVNSDVLIPRPETEGLVDLATAKICEMSALHELHIDTRPLRILEIGTGSGAIILALATELPQKYQIKESLLVATDISEQALEVAQANATELKVIDDICWLQDDLAASLCADAEFEGYFDIIFSNLPYVPTGDIAALPAMVKDYEPILALDGGVDGLELWRRLVDQTSYLLRTGGCLFGELHEQRVQQAAADLAEDFTWCNVEVNSDLAQRPRYISMEKQLGLTALISNLKRRQIGILPTDTVYGLVMAATKLADMKRFAQIKQRSAEQPLVLLLPSADDYLALVEPESNYEYLQSFVKHKWPGPTTLIVRASEYAQDKFVNFVHHTNNEASIALRVPNAPTLQKLIDLLGCPLASSSANRHNEPTPQTFADIASELLAEVDFAYNGDNAVSGAASEIFDCTQAEPKMIRKKE